MSVHCRKHFMTTEWSDTIFCDNIPLPWQQWTKGNRNIINNISTTGITSQPIWKVRRRSGVIGGEVTAGFPADFLRWHFWVIRTAPGKARRKKQQLPQFPSGKNLPTNLFYLSFYQVGEGPFSVLFSSHSCLAFLCQMSTCLLPVGGRLSKHLYIVGQEGGEGRVGHYWIVSTWAKHNSVLWSLWLRAFSCTILCSTFLDSHFQFTLR